jgi:hypothetical protein
MAFRIGTTQRNAACDGIVDSFDTGGAGSIQIRTGTQPTNVSDSPTGTLLGTLTLSATAFGNSSSGTATAATITSDSSADNSGTAGYFVVKNGSGTNCADGTCSTSGADMNFDNNIIVAGGVIAISSFTVTVPVS